MKDRLEEQQREQRVLHADIDSHRASIEAVSNVASELILNSSNARVAKRIESKLKDIQSRFEKLFDKSVQRGEFLEELSVALCQFQTAGSRFDNWYAEMIELIESRDYNKVDLEEFDIKINLLCHKFENQRSVYENLIKSGKSLITRKEITDVTIVRDKIKTLESLWKQLNNLIDEKQRLSKSRAERLSAYEKLRDQLLNWLNHTENKIQQVQFVTLDLNIIKQQIDVLRPIQKEYRDCASTIERVNDLGMAYDSLIRERSESPVRRRGVYSPLKKSHISSQCEFKINKISFLHFLC